MVLGLCKQVELDSTIAKVSNTANTGPTETVGQNERKLLSTKKSREEKRKMFEVETSFTGENNVDDLEEKVGVKENNRLEAEKIFSKDIN